MKADDLSKDSSSTGQGASVGQDIYSQIRVIVKSIFTGEQCKELREYILSVDIGEASDKKWDGVLFDSLKRVVEEYNNKSGILSTYEEEELVEEAYRFVTRRLKQGKFEVTEEAKKLCCDIIEWETNFKKDNQHTKNKLFLKARETHSGDELLQLVRKIGLTAFTANELMPSEGFENIHGYLKGIITNYNQRRREYDEASSDVEKATKFENENNIYYTIFTNITLDGLFGQAAQDPDKIKELCDNETIIEFYNNLKNSHDENKREEDQERYNKILSEIIKDNSIQPYAIVTEHSNHLTPDQDCLFLAIELEKELMSKDNINDNKERTYYIIANRSANHWITIQIKLSAKNEENEREINILMIDPAGGKEEIKEYKSTEKVPDNNPGYLKLPTLPAEYKFSSCTHIITNQQCNEVLLSTCGIRAVFNIGFITGIFDQLILPSNLGGISPKENEIRRVANKIINNKDNNEAKSIIETWITQAIRYPHKAEEETTSQVTEAQDIPHQPFLEKYEDTSPQTKNVQLKLISSQNNIEQDTKKLSEEIILLEEDKLKKNEDKEPAKKEYRDKKKESKLISFIDNLFEREFERIINNYGENSSKHCKDIFKKIIKINTAYYSSTPIDFNLDKFNNHLQKSKILINSLLKKNIRNTSLSEKNELILIIFLSLGLSAKLVNDYTSSINNPCIAELKIIFSKYYDLIKLSNYIINSEDNEHLFENTQVEGIENETLEEPEDFSKFTTHNPMYATNAQGVTYMPEYKSPDFDLRHIYQHYNQIFEILNQLINIFGYEFISITSKIEDTENCLQDIKDAKFKCFVEWHLDYFYLGKLYSSLESIPTLSDKDFWDKKQEYYGTLHRTFSLGYQIINSKLSDRIKKALENNAFYRVFKEYSRQGFHHELLLQTAAFDEITEKVSHINIMPVTFDSRVMSHYLSRINIELLINLKNLEIGLISEGVRKLTNIIKSHDQFNYIKSAPDSLTEQVTTQYNLLFNFHNSQKANLKDNESYILFLRHLRTKIDEIYKRLPENLFETSEITLYLEFYLSCFYEVIQVLLDNLEQEAYLNEEYKDHLKIIYSAIEHYIENEYLVLYNYERLIDKLMSAFNSIEFVFRNNAPEKALDKVSEIDSFYHIKLQEYYPPFKKGLEWSIPNLAVLIGKNGIGKTRILNGGLWKNPHK